MSSEDSSSPMHASSHLLTHTHLVSHLVSPLAPMSPRKEGKTQPLTTSDSPLTSLFLASLLVLRLLEHLLDNLLLLDQESSHDTVPHAVAASRAAICALNSLLGAGGRGVLSGAEGWDLLFSYI